MRKLRLRHRALPKPESDFDRLVLEAVKVQKRMDELDRAEAFRLTPDALFEEALKAGQTTRKRVDQLRQKLFTSEMPGCQSTLRRLATAIGLGNLSSGVNIGRIRPYSTESANVELAGNGFTLTELFAMAIGIAAKQYPDAFGTCTSPKAIRVEAAATRKKQQDLFRRISTSFTPADLDEEARDEQGRPVIAFRLGGSRVPIRPLESAGERLTRLLISESQGK